MRKTNITYIDILQYPHFEEFCALHVLSIYKDCVYRAVGFRPVCPSEPCDFGEKPACNLTLAHHKIVGNTTFDTKK